VMLEELQTGWKLDKHSGFFNFWFCVSAVNLLLKLQACSFSCKHKLSQRCTRQQKSQFCFCCGSAGSHQIQPFLR
jgi:hypothetical protein